MKMALQTLNFLLRFLNRVPPKLITFENIITHLVNKEFKPPYWNP